MLLALAVSGVELSGLIVYHWEASSWHFNIGIGVPGPPQKRQSWSHHITFWRFLMVVEA
jgi:hypothetical protein